ncbi:MAG: hypothetical protein KDH19_15525 [Geminicoccaceae bacterium]|nr:hypothetical protein [Geminicoccaceae bacterium]
MTRQVALAKILSQPNGQAARKAASASIQTGRIELSGKIDAKTTSWCSGV